jgi:hypothetical protein
MTNKMRLKEIHSTKVAITEPLLHASDWPPHSKAIVKHTSATSKKLKPGRSSCSRISFHVAGVGLICFGTSRKSINRVTMGPPSGKLIQKHHRHLALLLRVRAIGAKPE